MRRGGRDDLADENERRSEKASPRCAKGIDEKATEKGHDGVDERHGRLEKAVLRVVDAQIILDVLFEGAEHVGGIVAADRQKAGADQCDHAVAPHLNALSRLSRGRHGSGAIVRRHVRECRWPRRQKRLPLLTDARALARAHHSDLKRSENHQSKSFA